MKKNILLLLLSVTLFANAQNNTTDLPGRWRLGFNMGGIWESSDVKPIPGLGGGFTIEKILNKRSDALLGFSLGLRYLGGRTYGLNSSPTYDLANNRALNGTFNPAVKYDTVPGFFYANHKTFIQEGALELKMNFPRLEKRTGVIFHLWGGIGIGKYKTWIDALDKDGKMYDFSSVKGQPVAQSDLSRIYDKSYETLAEGSGTNGTLAFMPSLGVGLGYRLGRNVAIVFEHKVTFPGTNWLDGIDYRKNCPVTGTNDFYNYTSVGLVFTFYGGHHSSSINTSSSTNSSNNNTVYTNTTGTQTTNTGVNTNYTPTPVVYPPTVVITYPANNFSSLYDYTTINATIQNVSSSQQINISQNGYPINHFTYNASNGILHFQTFLAEGPNNFVIAASNISGTASQGVTINYNPIPTFTASSNNVITTTNSSTVTPTTTVVATSTVSTNTNVSTNTVTPNYTVSTTHTVSPTFTTSTNTSMTVAPTGTISTINTTSPTLTVNPHTNVTPTGTVSATFTTVASGTVSPTHTSTATFTATANATPTETVSPANSGTVTSIGGTLHGQTSGSVVKPIVSFIDPNTYPTETTALTYNVIGSVLNVNGAADIIVTVNGNNVPNFTFNTVNKQVNFTANLQLGYNTITIRGTNANGSDSKSSVINQKQAGSPPKVTITNPSTSPFTSLQSNVIVSGYVYNVVSSSYISVTANNAPTTFNYNLNTHEITVALNLLQGSTQVKIAATNPFGSDAGNIELIYKKVAVVSQGDTITTQVTTHTTQVTTVTTQTHTGVGGPPGGPHNPPVITVLSPNVDPFYTNTGNISVSGTIDFITNPNLVNVTYNGLQVSSTFDLPSKHLNFSSPLKPGLNTFVISASNVDGTVNKSVNINYAPIGGNTNPTNSVNSGPTYGHGSWNLGGVFNAGGTNNNQVTPAGQSTTPKKTEVQGGGQINPGRPIQNTSPVTVPSQTKPSGTDAAQPSAPVNGGQQIKTRPR